MGLEASEVGWFAADELLAEASLGRTRLAKLRRMIAHARVAALLAEFDRAAGAVHW